MSNSQAMANSAWEAVIRPPTTAGMLTITVAANAFSEGNAETSKDIRISTSFPDADADTGTAFLNLVGGRTLLGCAVTPNRILISNEQPVARIQFYTHAGVEQTSEVLTLAWGTLDYFNNSFLLKRSSQPVRFGIR